MIRTVVGTSYEPHKRDIFYKIFFIESFLFARGIYVCVFFPPYILSQLLFNQVGSTKIRKGMKIELTTSIIWLLKESHI